MLALEAPTPYALTGRELAVLCLLGAGRTNAHIGAELYISPTTARVHLSNILRKLGVSNRVQATRRAGLCGTGEASETSKRREAYWDRACG